MAVFVFLEGRGAPWTIYSLPGVALSQEPLTAAKINLIPSKFSSTVTEEKEKL